MMIFQVSGFRVGSGSCGFRFAFQGSGFNEGSRFKV